MGGRWQSISLSVSLLALPACSGGESGSAEGGMQVVASSYPLHYVAQQVAGSDIEVTNLTATGADSHATELTAAQTAALGQADLVVHLSGMQPDVDDALQVQSPDRLLDAAPLADLDGDPHFWLDPRRMASLGDQVAIELARVDPARAQEFRANAEALAGEMQTLATDFDRELAGCEGAALVTALEAFGYLADAHGLEQIGIAGIDPNVEPSPARVRDVIEVIEGRDVPTIFFDAAASPDVAETLAEDLGVGTAVLHPIERVARGETYPQLMRDNLTVLHDGLRCW